MDVRTGQAKTNGPSGKRYNNTWSGTVKSDSHTFYIIERAGVRPPPYSNDNVRA